MYFKERELSALYLHYQKQEHERLAKKVQSIKSRKQQLANISENILPPITYKPSQIRLYQKKLLAAQTDRLHKKLDEVKNNRSQYFSKVIGLNVSLDLSKAHKNLQIKNNKHLMIICDTQSQKCQALLEKKQ